MLSMLRNEEYSQAEEYWKTACEVSEFGPTALGQAIQKMRQGLVDPRHIESQVGMLKSVQTTLVDDFSRRASKQDGFSTSDMAAADFDDPMIGTRLYA